MLSLVLEPSEPSTGLLHTGDTQIPFLCNARADEGGDGGRVEGVEGGMRGGVRSVGADAIADDPATVVEEGIKGGLHVRSEGIELRGLR